MLRSRAKAAACVFIALLLAGCSSSSTSPKAIDAVLLHASDVPDMRLVAESQPITDPADLEEPLGHGEVFKIEGPAIAAKLAEFGFVRAHLEAFLGGGTHAQAFVAEFKSAADAQAARDFMYQQFFQPCPGEPQCSTRSPLAVPDIPQAKGQRVTPFRQPIFGNPVTLYKVLFVIGPLVYGMDVGGDPQFYDPGTVSPSTALAVFKDVYERVKGQAPDAVFKAVPARPLGLPAGADGAVSGSPPPGVPPPPSSTP
jgi:hypothetical protein